FPGQCGCAGANPAPAGKTCTDSIASPGTPQTCNGAGVCGNPSTVAPAPTCFPRRFDGHIYWFCPTPVSWNQAEANCRAQPGRSLARLSTLFENTFVAGLVGGAWWTGGNAQTAPGTWRWATSASNNGDQFWSGGPSGSRVANRFTRWAGGQPDASLTCATVNHAGDWAAMACAQTAGYVCEQQAPMTPPVPPRLDPGNFFPAVGVTTSGGVPSPDGGAGGPCVPASAVFDHPDGGLQPTLDEI